MAVTSASAHKEENERTGVPMLLALSTAMFSPQAHLRLTDLFAYPGGEQQREEYQEHGSCSVLLYVCKWKIRIVTNLIFRLISCLAPFFFIWQGEAELRVVVFCLLCCCCLFENKRQIPIIQVSCRCFAVMVKVLLETVLMRDVLGARWSVTCVRLGISEQDSSFFVISISTKLSFLGKKGTTEEKWDHLLLTPVFCCVGTVIMCWCSGGTHAVTVEFLEQGLPFHVGCLPRYLPIVLIWLSLGNIFLVYLSQMSEFMCTEFSA